MPHPYPALSPLDFERLCADLLGAEFSTRFETFTAGRDGGIDLRCHTDDGLVIGQAKHYQERAALIRAMRTEKDKLAQIEPARYLLVTSCALTPANKDTLLEILAPYCRSSADIYGRDELDTALARHPAVLRRHFKLWLQDAAQLSSILHNRLHQLSRARQAELADDLQTFVVPPMAATLLDRLARQHICVITGDAGVGKTTLCGYLALQLAAHDGYEVHVLRDTAAVGQAWDLLQPGQKQCFVLDDVFGATFLDTRQALALEHDLLSLLKQARRGDGRLKLMIASRGYVLQQGTARLPKLAQWLQAELHIDTIDHTRTPLRFKAEVLVNLLHYCGLGAAHKRAIADPRGYGQIISHAHFNPRLLKRLLDDGRQPDSRRCWSPPRWTRPPRAPGAARTACIRRDSSNGAQRPRRRWPTPRTPHGSATARSRLTGDASRNSSATCVARRRHWPKRPRCRCCQKSSRRSFRRTRTHDWPARSTNHGSPH